MNSLSEYILEKFKISKDITSHESDPDDPTTWGVGDILFTSWGYDMTIVDYYEIIKATGKSFVVKHLKDKIVSGSRQRGESMPILGEYESDKEIRCKISKYNYLKIDGEFAHLWNGKSQHTDTMD